MRKIFEKTDDKKQRIIEFYTQCVTYQKKIHYIFFGTNVQTDEFGMNPKLFRKGKKFIFCYLKSSNCECFQALQAAPTLAILC